MSGVNTIAVSVLAIPVFLFSILLPVGLVLVLQVFLCRKGNRLGLILPVLSFLLSLLLTLSVAAFTMMGAGTITTQTISNDGHVVKTQVEEVEAPPVEPQQLLMVGGVFLVTNIPTVVLTGIWVYHKNRRDWRKELEQMDIQDLS